MISTDPNSGAYTYYSENIFEALHQNTYTVFEAHGPLIKCFSYHKSTTDWERIIKWHRARHPRPVFCAMEIREISHPIIFDPKQPANYHDIIHHWVDLGVSPRHIIWVGNHHSMVNHNKLIKLLGLPIHSVWIRYFEGEAVFRHQHQITDYNRQGPQHQQLATLMSYDKKYLALFGKPRKFMRAGAMIQMTKKGMMKDAVISSLAEGQGIDECVEWASQYFDPRNLKDVFQRHAGSVDDVNYDAPHTDNSNYRGYPYDHTMYENTAMSIVAETNDIGVPGVITTEQFWITEKLCRPIYNYHPFVVLSTPYFLRDLRRLGYKTFDTIIDESYDNETDPHRRLDMALDASIELAKNLTSTHMRAIVVHNMDNLQAQYTTIMRQMEDIISFAGSRK